VTSGEGGFVSRALFPWGDPQTAEIYEVTIGPAHTETFPAAPAGTKKSLVLLAGEVSVTVGEDTPTRLCNGDAILFNADAQHQFRNTGDAEAKAFLVVTAFTRQA
jgi:quercetin dioxygenase-like cupin family protein